MQYCRAEDYSRAALAVRGVVADAIDQEPFPWDIAMSQGDEPNRRALTIQSEVVIDAIPRCPLFRVAPMVFELSGLERFQSDDAIDSTPIACAIPKSLFGVPMMQLGCRLHYALPDQASNGAMHIMLSIINNSVPGMAWTLMQFSLEHQMILFVQSVAAIRSALHTEGAAI